VAGAPPPASARARARGRGRGRGRVGATTTPGRLPPHRPPPPRVVARAFLLKFNLIHVLRTIVYMALVSTNHTDVIFLSSSRLDSAPPSPSGRRPATTPRDPDGPTAPLPEPMGRQEEATKRPQKLPYTQATPRSSVGSVVRLVLRPARRGGMAGWSPMVVSDV